MKYRPLNGRLPDEVRNQLIAASKIEQDKLPGESAARTRAINRITALAMFAYPELFKE